MSKDSSSKKPQGMSEADTTLVFNVNSLVGETAQEQDRLALLRVVAGGEQFQFHVLEPGSSAVVGRGVENALVMCQLGVSRRHAEVRFTSEGVCVMDLNSTNGTTVNDRRIVPLKPILLDDGDEIGVGPVTLRYEQVRAEEIEFLAEVAARVDASKRDSLTGLLTRGYLDQHIADLDPNDLMSVLFIDLDHFKSINDTYGHAAGDKVLRAVSTILTRSARSNDVIARYGGEEFVIVAHGCSEAGCVRLAERIRLAMVRFDWARAGVMRPVTTSIGIAERGDNEDLRTWLRRADEALYSAKRSGRNRSIPASLLDPRTARLVKRS